MGLLDLVTGWQTTAIALGLTALVAGGGGTYLGYSYRDARCVATIDQTALNQANARVIALEANIATMQAALDADATKASEDQAKMAELERTANDLRTNTSGGVCLPADDVERLRQWWRNGAPTSPAPRVRPR